MVKINIKKTEIDTNHLALMVLSIFFLLFLFYLQFIPDKYLPKQEEKESNVSSFNQTLSSENVLYETTELHWNHMPLKYRLDEYCKTKYNGELAEDIRAGIKYIEDETIISFKEVNYSEDILYTCNPNLTNQQHTNTIAQVETEYNGNHITHGTIYIYKSYNCYKKAPTLWVHETLHLLGIPDKTKSDSLDIMWSIEDNGKHCKQLKIIDEDKLYLENIYG